MTDSVGADHAYLFDAQLLMLDDPMLIERAAQIVRGERLNAESALQRSLQQISALFDRGEDPYLRERKGDVADVVGRLVHEPARGGRSDRSLQGPRRPAGARRRRDHAVGDRAARLVEARGARHRRRQLDLSHRHPGALAAHPGRCRPAQRQLGDSAGRATWPSTARPARSSSIPTSRRWQQVAARRRRREAYEQSLDEFRPLPAVTEDGVAIRLEANIESPDDAGRARGAGRRGHRAVPIGVPARRRRPERARRRGAVRRLPAAASRARPRRPRDGPHVRRQRAAAAASSMPASKGTRAPLGLRGIRLSLALDEHLPGAAARAAARRRATARCGSCFRSSPASTSCARRAAPWSRGGGDAARARRLRSPDVPIGVMIEVPSAALTADLLAARSRLLQHRHQRPDPVPPGRRSHRRSGVAALRAAAPGDPPDACGWWRAPARRARIPVAVCGEMAADPVLLTLLVGLGLTEFSMAPTAIRAGEAGAARRAASRCAAHGRRGALRAGTPADVEQALVDFWRPRRPRDDGPSRRPTTTARRRASEHE